MTQQCDITFDIHRKMVENNVLLAYTGEFNMKMVNALVTSVKKKLHEVEQGSRIKKKVYNVMVESLETILSYHQAIQKQNQLINSFSIFSLSRDKECYYLVSGNYIFNDSRELRKKQIDQINELNTEGKKGLYRERVADKANYNYDIDLALVDIAIKSGSPLSYQFKNVDSLTSFYIFQVKIKIQ
jgi:hypothetical protein